ncbi:MAG: DUF6666 family protein, partial [Planctomycetia bacterium]
MERRRRRTLARLSGAAVGCLFAAAVTFGGEPSSEIIVLDPAVVESTVETAAAPDWKLDDGWSPFDTLSVFGGLEASRQPQDLGINANFGGTFAANWGLPLAPSLGVGAQVGVGVNLSKAGVKVLRVVEGTTDRVQTFTTLGLFRRTEGWYAAAAYDFQFSNYFATTTTGQVRAETAVNFGVRDEIGLWGTLATQGDDVEVLGRQFQLQPISQINVFWNHVWKTGAETRFWLGVAGQHGVDIVSLPDTARSDPAITFGLQVFAPLDDHF